MRRVRRVPAAARGVRGGGPARSDAVLRRRAPAHRIPAPTCREANPASLVPVVAWGAFALAFVFGFVGNKTNFCTMGAVSDIVNMGDWNRMRMWLLAIAVAILGVERARARRACSSSRSSIYPGPNFTWLSYIVGGALVRHRHDARLGLRIKTLIRVGGGNLKSLVVLVFMAIAAYMTLRGLFGTVRVGVLEPVVGAARRRAGPAVALRPTGSAPSGGRW